MHVKKTVCKAIAASRVNLLALLEETAGPLIGRVVGPAIREQLRGHLADRRESVWEGIDNPPHIQTKGSVPRSYSRGTYVHLLLPQSHS